MFNKSTEQYPVCIEETIQRRNEGSSRNITKAIETVGQELLIESLAEIGIREKCLDLFVSYLSDRTQFVKIDDIWSHKRNIQYGLPHGTILGPTLFNIYTNGMFTIDSRGDIIRFADDFSIFNEADGKIPVQ